MAGIAFRVLGMQFKMNYFLAIFFCFFGYLGLAQAQNDAVSANKERFGTSQPRERHREAKSLVDQVKSDQSIGENVAKRYKSDGSEFSANQDGQKAFKSNPYQSFSPWMATWLIDEKKLQSAGGKVGMDKTTHPCATWYEQPWHKQRCFFDVSRYITAKTGVYVLKTCTQGRHDVGSAGQQVWEYWRAENQFEANNFNTSEIQNLTGYRAIHQGLKEIRTKMNLNALRGGDVRPGGLKKTPHSGQSHFEGSGAMPTDGQYNQFEVHATRTRHDIQRAYDYNQGDEFSYLKECMPPLDHEDIIVPTIINKKRRFTFFNSESIPELWRLPELSNRRYQGAVPPYMQIYGKLYDLALKAGKDYHGNTMFPKSGSQPASGSPKNNSMNVNSLCSSYWLSNKGGWDPAGEFSMDKATNNLIQAAGGQDWKRLCYHPAVTTLFPLTGVISTDDNKIAPLTAIRRFMDWTSWQGLDGETPAGAFDHKTNFMDDDFGQAIFKDAMHNPQLAPFRFPDRLQRLNPAPSPACFHMRDVNPRSKLIDFGPNFGKAMAQSSFQGSHRYAQWNRRKLCICTEGTMWIPGRPETEVPFRPVTGPVCIPWEE